MAGIVRFIPIERLNSVLAISAQPQQLEQVQDWMERLDRSGSLADQSFHVVPLQNRPAKEVAELLQRTLSDDPRISRHVDAVDNVRPDMTPVVTESPRKATPTARPARQQRGLSSRRSPRWPRATGKPIRIQADDGNNSLLILSTPEEFQLLQQVVTLLDVTPNQVMLEATIAEVTLNDDLPYGINWFLESGEFNLTFSDADNWRRCADLPGLLGAVQRPGRSCGAVGRRQHHGCESAVVAVADGARQPHGHAAGRRSGSDRHADVGLDDRSECADREPGRDARHGRDPEGHAAGQRRRPRDRSISSRKCPT